MKFNVMYVLSLLTGIIESLFFGGLIFGWSSISVVLKKEGYFSNYCPNVTANSATLPDNATTTDTPVKEDCHLQNENVNLVFTIASVAMSFSTLPNGYFFDRFGTWASRVLAILLFTFGCALVAASRVATSWILYPAMCCISVGGILLLVTNMQLGNLFLARSSVITVLNGALDSSSFVFLLVKLAYDQGINFGAIFQFIAVCTVFLWFRTILLMPRMHVPFPLPSGFVFGLRDCCLKSDKNSPDQSKECLEESSQDGKNTLEVKTLPAPEERTFLSFVKTIPFWTNAIHFSILQLRNYFFLSTFFEWMSGMVEKSGEGASLDVYINTFGICQFFGVLTAPLNGFLIDGMKKFYSKTKQGAAVSSEKAVAVSAFTTSTLAVLFSIAVAIPVPEVQYISFVLQVVFRSFLYGGNASFIAFFYPVQHFGKLYGSTMTLAGIAALLQFPLFSLVLRQLDGDFTAVNVTFLIVSGLTFLHPLFLYWRSCKMEKEAKVPDEAKKAVEMQSLTGAENM